MKHLEEDIRKWNDRSPLTQGRGLKQLKIVIEDFMDLSPLTQGRGLKRLRSARQLVQLKVAPHAGARIETSPCRGNP